MALCPNCKQEVNKENIRKERIEGIVAGTFLWSCPHCKVILGITQITSY